MIKQNIYCFYLKKKDNAEPVRLFDITALKHGKITSSIWGTLEDTIITGHETGEIMLWDMRKKSCEKKIRPHTKTVMDLQKDRDSSCVISASKDSTSRVWFI